MGIVVPLIRVLGLLDEARVGWQTGVAIWDGGGGEAARGERSR